MEVMRYTVGRGGQSTRENSPNSDLRRRTTGNQGYTEGNIHRLRNQDDDDDDNNTWNGNSTQQM
ncbi:hypothetical protein QZH41_015104 [Actinostola sp. cb2023]|nr:hypothetical protein QZH41_015104 [Actinostola sp. cb2023]